MAISDELALMDYFLSIMQKARKEGLLVLEEVIKSIETQKDFGVFDLIYTGLRMVVEGYDSEVIERIFDNYHTLSFDELSFNIITQGCLAIQRGDGCIKLILYYASLLPEKIRNSEPFLKLVEKYGYQLRYETWAEHEAKRKAESVEKENR